MPGFTGIQHVYYINHTINFFNLPNDQLSPTIDDYELNKGFSVLLHSVSLCLLHVDYRYKKEVLAKYRRYIYQHEQ